MSKHGLTRVRFRGDKVFIVAGSIPEHLAKDAVDAEPVPPPGSGRHFVKPTVEPATPEVEKEESK